MLMQSVVCGERQDAGQLAGGVMQATAGVVCDRDRLMPQAAAKRCQYELMDPSNASAASVKRPCPVFNIESLLSRSYAGTMMPQATAQGLNAAAGSAEQAGGTASAAEFKPPLVPSLPTTWPGQNGAAGLPANGRGFDMLQDTRISGAEQTPLSHVPQQVIPLAYGNVKPYSTPWMQPQTWPSTEPAPSTPIAPSMRYPDNVNVLMWQPMALQSHVEAFPNSSAGPRPNMMNSTPPPVQGAAANTYYKPSPPFWFGAGGSGEYGYQHPAPGFDLRYAFPAAALSFHGRTARLVNPMYRSHISEQHRPVTCTLHNSDLWKVFHQHTTEMVITKAGRRMFPIIEVKLDGLYPERTYAVVIDIVPADQYHWKFTGTEWRIGGPRCEPPMPSRLYVHQESPSSGLHWMQDILGFGKLKITNDKATPGQEIVLDSLHKYVVRLHVACFHHTSDYAEIVHTSIFHETSFIAVTAYQNNQMTQLKIEHNPFAKGFREGSAGRPSARRSRQKSEERNSEDGGEKSPSSDDGTGALPRDVSACWNPPTKRAVDGDGEGQSSLGSV